MDVEAETRELRSDLAALTNNVTRIATIVESSEKRHDSAMVAIKELGDKVVATTGMKEDIAQLREDLRVTRHDLTTALNAISGLPLLNEKVGEMKADFMEKITAVKTDLATVTGKVDGMEKRNDKLDGGAAVAQKIGGGLWAFLGGAVALAANYLLTRYSGGIGGE